jgi:hypothetical protein
MGLVWLPETRRETSGVLHVPIRKDPVLPGLGAGAHLEHPIEQTVKEHFQQILDDGLLDKTASRR